MLSGVKLNPKGKFKEIDLNLQLPLNISIAASEMVATERNGSLVEISKGNRFKTKNKRVFHLCRVSQNIVEN